MGLQGGAPGNQLLVEQAFDAEKDFVTRKRLLHEIIGPDAGAEKLLHRLLVAAHHDHRDVTQHRVATDGPQGGEAVHAGQHDIEKNQFRPVLPHQRQSGFGVERLVGFIAGRAQELAQGDQDGLGVVDDQYTRPFAGIDAGLLAPLDDAVGGLGGCCGTVIAPEQRPDLIEYSQDFLLAWHW